MRRTEVIPADLQAAGDFGFADAGTLELSHLVGVEGCCEWPAQALAVLACVRQAGADSFPENLSFELGKDGQQACHRSTSGCGQIQRFGQRHETDSQMLQFL
jgi:hypothetical protein